MPLDVDRVVELPWTGELVAEAAPSRVLDLASPKLLACWLAEHTSADVVATDLWPAEIERWRSPCSSRGTEWSAVPATDARSG